MGMSHLVGTPLLRAYMHGYFVHQRLWQKAAGLAPGPSAAAAQRTAAVAQQLEAQRASRITLLKRLPKVGLAVGVTMRIRCLGCVCSDMCGLTWA